MNTNVVILSGRLVRDPELRYTSTGKAVTNFTLAVNRNKDEADFIPIVVWETTAENITKFLTKGSQAIITGRLTQRNYEDKDGNKRLMTEVVANRVEFIGGTSSTPNKNTPPKEETIPF